MSSGLPKEAENIVTVILKIVGVTVGIAITIHFLGGGVGDYVAALLAVLVVACGLEIIRHI